MSDRLLTSAEVAEIVGFTAGTVVDWYEAEKLPGYKMGGRLRFWESEVLAWIETKRGPGAGGEVLPTPATPPTRGVVSQLLPTPLGGGTDAS